MDTSLNTRSRNYLRRHTYVLTKHLPPLYFLGAKVNVGDKFILNEGNRNTNYVFIESMNSGFPNIEVYRLTSKVFFDNFSPTENYRKAFGKTKKNKKQKRNKRRKSRKSRK